MVLIKNKLPPQSKLREDFTYDAATGDLFRYDGYCGCLIKNGYWLFNYEDARYLAHRLIWKWWYGYDPEEVDHINGDGTDNRIDNLRNVNRSINNKNSKKKRNNTSGFTGVAWDKEQSLWLSYVNIDKKMIKIGRYNTPQEAKEAREEFIKEFHPDHFSERHGL